MNEVGFWFCKLTDLSFLPQVTFQTHHFVSEELIATKHQKIEPLSRCQSLHFIFVEVYNKLFPNIPKTAIKSCMRNLGLKLLKVPEEIQDKLRTTRPYLACEKVLSLISR